MGTVLEVKQQQQQQQQQHEEDEETFDDDWGLPCDFRLFAQHEARRVWLGLTKGGEEDGDADADGDDQDNDFRILCVESLTPLDMVNLGNGLHDATGHCVWTACFLWLAALQTNEITLPPSSTMIRVLELGSGTGLGGLATLKHFSKIMDNDNHGSSACHVTLTDADPDALDLCRRNAVLNGVDSRTTVQPLTWGDTDDLSVGLRGTMDIVLAADILYDIRMLPSIRQTALACCKTNAGIFYLSHVPRACFTSETTAGTTLQGVDGSLEDYIVQEMTESQRMVEGDDDDDHEVTFSLVRIIRPIDLLSSGWQPPPKSAFVKNNNDDDENFNYINDTSLQEMQDIGAALFVFQKKKV